MSNWKYKLRIKPEWEARKEGKITITELAQAVIKKLEALNIEDDFELDNIIDDFQDFCDQNNPMIDEFDEIWGQLYDWADQQLDYKWPPAKMCWIETF